MYQLWARRAELSVVEHRRPTPDTRRNRGEGPLSRTGAHEAERSQGATQAPRQVQAPWIERARVDAMCAPPRRPEQTLRPPRSGPRGLRRGPVVKSCGAPSCTAQDVTRPRTQTYTASRIGHGITSGSPDHISVSAPVPPSVPRPLTRPRQFSYLPFEASPRTATAGPISSAHKAIIPSAAPSGQTTRTTAPLSHMRDADLPR